MDGAEEDTMAPGDLPVKAWWAKTAEADLAGFQPKLAEYGSGDLLAIGTDMATLIKWADAPDRVKAELGTFFYLRGKVARMTTAYEHQRLPSDDTLHDATVYSMMMRRIRARGVLE